MNKVLTISREYSSGGREIGKKLAEIWGVPFYDNELIKHLNLLRAEPPAACFIR